MQKHEFVVATCPPRQILGQNLNRLNRRHNIFLPSYLMASSGSASSPAAAVGGDDLLLRSYNPSASSSFYSDPTDYSAALWHHHHQQQQQKQHLQQHVMAAPIQSNKHCQQQGTMPSVAYGADQQQMPQFTTSSGFNFNGFHPSSLRNATLSGVNNTTVKIDIHCGNQSNPVNIESPKTINQMMAGHNNVTSAGGSYQSLASNFNCPVGYQQSSLHSGCVSVSGGEQHNSSCDASKMRENKMVDYDIADVPTISPGSSSKSDQINELTQMAMNGCELAERLAHTHRNRPCFKKIDSLCARMKQDLVRPDSVMANINSQGVAWAVKDFIFVFTRIINAWIIIKGYVYNTPDGLGNVKQSISPEFNDSFAKWEDSTKDFVDNLIKSFVGLDQMVQTQRASFHKSDASKMHANSGGAVTSIPSSGVTTNQQQPIQQQQQQRYNVNLPSHRNDKIEESFDYFLKLFSRDGDALSSSAAAATGTPPSLLLQYHHNKQQSESIISSNKSDKSQSSLGGGGGGVGSNYFLNVVEDSEETQRQAMEHGTYFKTGLYNPLKNDVMIQSNRPTMMMTTPATNRSPNDPKTIYTQSIINAPPPPPLPVPSSSKLTAPFSLMNRVASPECSNVVWEKANKSAMLYYQQRPASSSDAKIMPVHDPSIVVANNIAAAEQQVGQKIEYLLFKVCNIREVEYFFTSQFSKNYFPDFQSAVANYMDLRTIIQKAQIGGYRNIFEIVHDLRQIVYCAKRYLQKNPHLLLMNSIVSFEKELESILHETFLTGYDFSHITGAPSDDLLYKINAHSF